MGKLNTLAKIAEFIFDNYENERTLEINLRQKFRNEYQVFVLWAAMNTDHAFAFKDNDTGGHIKLNQAGIKEMVKLLNIQFNQRYSIIIIALTLLLTIGGIWQIGKDILPTDYLVGGGIMLLVIIVFVILASIYRLNRDGS
ncbi:MAG: hypothetical protein HY364_04315 [Candidatus Aenigmarchaeota archaeon]|nr:hypothetical protein [Candidatus Aenigmarchaeota archaeon]